MRVVVLQRCSHASYNAAALSTTRSTAATRAITPQCCSHAQRRNKIATRVAAPQRCSLQRRNAIATRTVVSQQHDLQWRNNMICNDVVLSCSATFVALSLAIDVSRTPDSAAFATKLRVVLQHHCNVFYRIFVERPSGFYRTFVQPPLGFCQTFVRRPSGFCRTVLHRWLLKSCIRHCWRHCLRHCTAILHPAVWCLDVLHTIVL